MSSLFYPFCHCFIISPSSKLVYSLFQIEFESGAKVEFYSTTGLGNLNIDIPSNYLGYTRGLCGSYDRDTSNDLKDRNGNVWPNGAGHVGPAEFTESWR